MTDSEKRYAQIEKECLATVWVCEKFSKCLYGLDDETDYKPLAPLFNVKDIDAVPLRYQRLLLRMMKFNTKAVYVLGKELIVAHTLSRHPTVTLHLDKVKIPEDTEALEDATRVSWPMSSSRLDEIKRLTKDDAELQTVIWCVSEDRSKYASKVPSSIMQIQCCQKKNLPHDKLQLTPLWRQDCCPTANGQRLLDTWPL